MCYLIAKNNQGGSSLAIQMMHGKELAKLKQKLLSDLPGEEIQLLTVSRPSAYTEYEPFCFMDTPDHFAQEVKNSFSWTSSEALRLYGVLTGMALPCILFPSALTTSIGTVLMPAVSAAQASDDNRRIIRCHIEKSFYRTGTIYFCSLI